MAGAGSGKTRVLAYRIAYAIEQGWVPADRVLALTFTNKAAKEMRQRVSALLSEQSETLSSRPKGVQSKSAPVHYPLSIIHLDGLPILSTFHSLGVKVLRQHGYLLGLPRSFAILDNEDQLKVLKEVFALSGIDESLQPRAVLHFIHTIKNTGLLPEVVAQNYRGFLAQQFLACHTAYQAALYKQGSVDLDDLIALPVRLLTQFPEVQAFYQNIFRYILVDEYQDTNPIQYQFLKLLSPPAPLFVVGDDAQSIYSFRGSDITNILNFERDFPESRVIVLDQNYRSTQNVLAVADAVLKHSVEQKPKVLWTENSTGQRVVVKELGNETDEADFIVGTIIDSVTGEAQNQESRIKNQESEKEERPSLLQEGLIEEYADYKEDAQERPFSVLDYMLGQKRAKHLVPKISRVLPEAHSSLGQFAVLYRTHAQSRAIEAAMVAAAIPYKIVGGVRFFDRKEIKDAISFLRIMVNVRDAIALTRAFSVPPKGIGGKTGAQIKELVHAMYQKQGVSGEWGIAENNMLIQELVQEVSGVASTKVKPAVVGFFRMLAAFSAVPVDFALHDLVRRVIDETGLLKYYGDGSEAGEARTENLTELVSVAQKFSAKPWQEALVEFLEEVALMSDLDAISDLDDAVTIMTLHAAKGLEFDTVFFAGLEEGLLPHSRSMLDPKAFAEEVRLAYVGITRAKKRLFMTHVRQRGLFGESRMAVPSRLLRELPNTAVSWHGTRPKPLPPHSLDSGGIAYEPFED